jgi:hypothetical protein
MYRKIPLESLEITLPSFNDQFTQLGAMRNHSFLQVTPQQEQECPEFATFDHIQGLEASHKYKHNDIEGE